MRRALAGSRLLSLSACPVGVFLMLRRMSLSGDAMAHAILPGAAAGFVRVRVSRLLPMTFGGLVAGLIVALASGAVSRLTLQREDASLAAFYLISLALGVLLVSLKGSSVDLMHVLFGTVLALNDQALCLIGGIAAVTLVALAADLARARRGMHRSAVPAQRQPRGTVRALRLSGARGSQSGRRV